MLRDGSRVSIRPIHALDVELERRFIEDPSPQSRRFRFMESMKSPPPARGIESTHSSDAADNEAMRKFADHPHCHHKRDPDDAKLVLYSVDLKTAIG